MRSQWCYLADSSPALIVQRAHWQAHNGSISSVDLIPAQVAGSEADAPTSSTPSSSGQVLILTGSRDCNVALWTLDGGLVGVLGDHSWDLDDPGTWQDPKGLAQRAPRYPESREDTDGEVSSICMLPAKPEPQPLRSADRPVCCEAMRLFLQHAETVQYVEVVAA